MNAQTAILAATAGAVTLLGLELFTAKRVIDAVKPDVLVLDVTPTELRTRKVWPGKVEYTDVIFPWLDATRAPAYGSEPTKRCSSS